MPDYIYKGKRYSDKQMETFAKDNGLSLNDYASQVGATYVAPGEQTFQYKDKEYSKTQIETFAKDNSLSFDDYLKETGTVKKKGGLASMLTGAASSVGGMVGSGAGRSEEKKDSRLDHLGMETRPQNKIVAHGVKPIQREEDKKLSDEEITNEALRRFNSPLTLYQKSKQEGIQNVPIGEDDPIGNAVNNIQNEAKLAYGELPEKFNVSDIRYATKSLNELAVKDRQIKLLKEYSIENNGIATSLTKQFVDKSAGADVGNINNIPLEEIQKTIPQNNLTAQIAFNRYAKDRTLSEISDKFATFDEMVAHVQGVKLGDLSEAKAGTLIDEMLSDPSVIEKTKESADFANKYRQAQFDLYNKYPSYGMKKMGQMIGQKLADKDMTGWLYSNPSVEKIQKAIDYLKQDGVWGEREDQFYKYNIFPKLLLPGDKGDIIPLTDLGHQTGYAVYHGFDNVSKSLRDIVGKAGGSFLDPSGNSLFQNLGLMKSEEELSKEREQIQYSAPQAEAKNWFTKYIGGAGAFAGTFTPVILGNMAGVPNAANLLLLFEGQNAEKAKDLFKGDVGKQAVYTTLSTLLDVSLMDIVPSVKAAAGIKKMVSSDVLKWTNDLASKKITEDALRRRVIESIPTYLGKIGVHNTKTATILSVYDLAHKGLDAISGKYDFKLANELEEVVNNAKSNWFAGTFMSGMAASGEMKKYSAAIGKVYKEVSEDPIPYIELIRRDKKLSDAEKEDRIKNIEHLAGINYEIGKRGIKGKKAEDFLRLELQKRVADDAVKESKSALLSQEDKKKSAIYEIEQERILNPGISNTEHLDKLFEYLPDGIKKDLSTDGKFDEQKVEGFLKYIAQQSNGLDADWKPHKDGKIPSMSDVPESIIRIANERWAKEIEDATAKEEAQGESTVESAVIEIGGKMYEGKNHAEAILKAKADGQDISNVNRQAEGKFKLSDGTIIDRAEAKSRFGQDRSELMIEQDAAADQANKDYRKITDGQASNTDSVGGDEKIKLPKGAKEVFHYSENESLSKLEDREGGTWFTDNGYGYQRRPGVKGKVSKVIEPDNLNLATEKQVWAAGEGDWANGVKKIKEQGFDGIKQTVDGDKHYLVFDLKNVKDKSDYATKETTKAETTTQEGNAEKVAKLESERDMAILRERVPEMGNVNEVVPTREAVSAGSNADNLTVNKRKRADLKNRYTDLKKLFECLTK